MVMWTCPHIIHREGVPVACAPTHAKAVCCALPIVRMAINGASPQLVQVLEELYPEMPLLPAQGSPERQRADDLLRLERRLFGAWLQWLCNGW